MGVEGRVWGEVEFEVMIEIRCEMADLGFFSIGWAELGGVLPLNLIVGQGPAICRLASTMHLCG